MNKTPKAAAPAAPRAAGTASAGSTSTTESGLSAGDQGAPASGAGTTDADPADLTDSDAGQGDAAGAAGADAAPRLVKARVLTACRFGKANDVVSVTEAEANSPDLDTHPDAVAYAESLQARAES